MRTAILFVMSFGLPFWAHSQATNLLPQAGRDLLISQATFFQRLEDSLEDTTVIFVESAKYADGKARVGCVAGLVNAPGDKVWEIITDYRNYTHWIPRCTRSIVVGAEILPALGDSCRIPLSSDISACLVHHSAPSDTTLLYSEIDIIFPVGRIRSLLEILSDSTDFTVYWKKLASDIPIYEGAWHIVPRGDQTLVICMMRYRLNVWLPPFIIHGAIRYYLPQMIAGLRHRVYEEPQG